MKDVILTPEGYKQLKSELDRLRTEKRREIAERIAAARAFGEIAENAEYDDAKNEQMMLEHRIAQLDERLANARVINPKDIDTSVVSVGSLVRLRDVDAKETVEYFIVGSAEANPVERKLSNESPVGKAIMGRKKGETVEVGPRADRSSSSRSWRSRPRSVPRSSASADTIPTPSWTRSFSSYSTYSSRAPAGHRGSRRRRRAHATEAAGRPKTLDLGPEPRLERGI